MVAFNFTTTQPRTCRRLPDAQVWFQRTAYNSTREEAGSFRQFQYTFQPQYTIYNQSNSPSGSTGIITRWETWLYLPTVERKFSYLPAGTGSTGAGSVPAWWNDYLNKFHWIDPGGGANATTVAAYFLNAPRSANKTFPFISPGPSGRVTTPLTVLQNPGSVQLGWIGALPRLTAFQFARFTQVGNLDTLYSLEGSVPVIVPDTVITPSGFSIFYSIPEMRKPSNHNYVWAQRSVGELRPRVYDLVIGGPGDISGNGYHIVMDDPTLDAFFNSTGDVQNSNPVIAPGNEGVLFTHAGTFESQTTRFLIWVSCDGLFWRHLIWRGTSPSVTSILNEAAGGLFHQDPEGNYFFISGSVSNLLPLTSFGLSSLLGNVTISSFPPVELCCTPVKEFC